MPHVTGRSAPFGWITARTGSDSSRHQVTSVMSPNVQIIAMPLPFSGSASACARTGTGTPNSGVVTSVPKSGLYRSSSGCATSATQAGISSGRVVSISIGRRRRARREANPVIGARLLAILELRLRHRGAEVHVPQRRRLELIRDAALQQPQERRLRHPLRAAVDRGVGHRPVHRQAEVPPQVLERLLVFGGQAQLHSSMKFGRETETACLPGFSGG